MLELVLCAIFVFAMCSVSMANGEKAYKSGLQDGLNISKGKDTKESKTFVISKPKGNKDDVEVDKMLEGFNNIMNYDGNKKVVD